MRPERASQHKRRGPLTRLFALITTLFIGL
jgi:hypothetical protein